MAAADARHDIDAARVHAQLQRRLEFERLISSASASLIRAGDERLDQAIVEALGSIGGFLDVDRAYVFVFDAAAGTQSNTHEWVRDGVSPEAANLQDIPLDVFPWLQKQLLADQTVQVNRVQDMPPEAVSERAEFEREGIQSILIMPLWRGDVLHGFVGFDVVRHAHDWGEEFVLGLQLLAQMLAGAMSARALSQHLRELAFQDPLTRLPNRKLLEDRIDQGLNGGGIVLALVDLDDFKRINDLHGHAIGDRVLCETARRLRAAVRDGDTVARLGGDEFVVVVPGAHPDDLERIGNRLIEVGSGGFELEGLQLVLGLSVGLVHATDARADRDDLLRRADVAMYRAKRAGKGTWIAVGDDEGEPA